MMTKAAEQSDEERAAEASQDKIFIEMPIPRTLAEIGFLQAEKDIKAGKEGTGSTLYGIVTGLKADMSGAAEKPHLLENEEQEEKVVVEEDEEVIKIEEEWIHPKDRPKATKEERKANQKLVKEAQREKRKHKMPKHEKKRKEKNSSGKK